MGRFMHSTGFCVPWPVSLFLVCGYGPHGGLLPVALPVAPVLRDSVPAIFVLPVIIAAAYDEAGLVPDDLAADREPRCFEAVGNRASNAARHARRRRRHRERAPTLHASRRGRHW